MHATGRNAVGSSVGGDGGAPASAPGAGAYRQTLDTRWCLRPSAQPDWGSRPPSYFLEALGGIEAAPAAAAAAAAAAATAAAAGCASGL